jgi:TrmH family RNA methyltransferase
MAVASVSAAGLQRARRLGDRKVRARTGQFLVEGVSVVREALAARAVQRLLATAEAAAKYPDLVADGYDQLDPGQAASLASTVSPAGLFAVARLPDWTLDDAVGPGARLVVICDQVRDPGNLGTLVRCADGLGADAVVVSTHSVEVTNPKAVRASAGSLFHLPVVAGADLTAAVARAKASGLRVLAADTAGVDLGQLGPQVLGAPVAWLFGNEAWGLPGPHRHLADQVVRVEMWGPTESLNLASAAAICLYATAARQRPAAPGPVGALDGKERR